MFQSMLANLPGVVYRCRYDKHWTSEYISEGIEELVGYPASDFLFNRIRTFTSIIHPDDQKLVSQIIEIGITKKQPYVVDYRICHADGTVKWVNERGQGVFDENGNILYLDGVILDINERKQKAQDLENALAELQRMQAQLIQSEKMSSLGQLVAGVAHEINNPVSFIHGNLTHAKDYISDLFALIQKYQKYYPHPNSEIQEAIQVVDLDFVMQDLPKLLSSMKVGTERIKKIVLELRNFSRMDESESKKVNIHEGIDSTLMILENRLKATTNYPAIEVIKEYGNLSLVECYPGQLNQVFLNVLSNAIEALRESTANTLGLITNPLISIRTEMLSCDRVVIRIADNGLGMAEALRKRVFDPFFTTKAPGKGTGMGLSICYQIVTKLHVGNFQCISSPGNGAEFVIEIPIQISTSINTSAEV